MIIRKKFKFEASHIVRNCFSERCKYSIHGHSYELEIFLSANKLDNGQMIYDFGLLKGFMKSFIDSFDHATIFWDKDDPDYIDSIKKHSDRYISLPVSSSAEMLSLFFLKALNFILQSTNFNNGESAITITSVRVHETATGYAESFAEDLLNENFPAINLSEVVFSPAIMKDWPDADLWQDLLSGKRRIENPSTEIQVPVD